MGGRLTEGGDFFPLGKDCLGFEFPVIGEAYANGQRLLWPYFRSLDSPVSSLPSHLSGVSAESLVQSSGILALLGCEVANDGSNIVGRHCVHQVPTDQLRTPVNTHCGQTVAVIAVPARGAMQLTRMLVRPPSMASARARPIKAALAVE